MIETDGLASRLTIVLLTYNCAHRLALVLGHLTALGLPVIAVDNASTDGTPDVLARHGGIDVITLNQNIGAAARNVGARRAATDYVAFCDDDGWYDLAGFHHAVNLFDQHDKLALVNARILVKEQGYLDPISQEMAASPLPDTAGIPGAVLMSFMGGASMVRKTAYEQVGGYDQEFFLGGEEETLAFKLVQARWQMRYLPDMVMHHHPSVANAPTLRAFGMRNTLWNAWIHRRFTSAIKYTVFTLADTPKNRDWVRGLAMALSGTRWVAARRTPMPRDLDEALTILQRRRTRRRLLTWRDPIHDIARAARRDQDPLTVEDRCPCTDPT